MMDLLMTMGDIESVKDDFAADDVSVMHDTVMFVNEIPESVTTGLVCYNGRFKGDPRPFKVIDPCSGRYLRGFASYEEAACFASNPRKCA